jgi:hypothetical protein
MPTDTHGWYKGREHLTEGLVELAAASRDDSEAEFVRETARGAERAGLLSRQDKQDIETLVDVREDVRADPPQTTPAEP